jgi:SPASM domain peptide maturase of grasp-with-spasm system
LLELFNKNHLLDLDYYRSRFDIDNYKIFAEYILLLEQYEFIFRCDMNEAKHFPVLSMEWDFPGEITNCIIDMSESLLLDYETIINSELNSINCRYVQLRGFEFISWDFLQKIIDKISASEIMAVDLIVKDIQSEFSHEKITVWVQNNKKIRSLILHSSFANKDIQEFNLGFGFVMTIKDTINSSNHCGIIHSGYFSTNIKTFTESQHHNTCLNRKISIDENGEIKNCPSMAKSYGNIRDTKLIDVVNNPEFQKVWHIKKDEITKCKACEFRHICTDCRAYLENADDLYSAPLKCGYDKLTSRPFL